MALPSFDTKDALDAALPKLAEFIPDLTADAWVEHEGKLIDKDLHTERGKRATVIQEKKTEEDKRKAAERERDEAAQRLAGMNSGKTDEELAAYRKPLDDQITDLSSKLEAVSNVVAEKDKTILSLRRDGKVLALMQPLVIPERFDEDEQKIVFKMFGADEKGELFVVDEAGNRTAEKPLDRIERHRQKKEWIFKGIDSSGSHDTATRRTSTQSAPGGDVAVANAHMVRGAL